MSKKKKVLCPYCGERMEFQDGLFSLAWLKCPKCNSCAPQVKGDSPELRRANAFFVARRMMHETKTEKQKPLTLDELRNTTALSWVWIEILDPSAFSFLLYVSCRSGYYRKQVDTTQGHAFCCGYPGLQFPFWYEGYGKTWVAFRHEPTEEECEAVKREEIDNQ